MLRRSPRPSHLQMEPLEIRCNLSVIDPLAGALAEPIQVPCDVVETGVFAPSHDSADRAGTDNAPSTQSRGSNINISTGWERVYPTD
jgi:hypothetical protein